jgi:hypothetical protein
MSQTVPSTRSNATRLFPSPSETVSKFLGAFSYRQTILQSIRGIAIGILTLLCSALLIVELDWMSLIPDTARWSMSCAAYAVAVGMAWRTGAMNLFLSPSMESIAWSVEQSRPILRESLLSTVELRRPDGSARSGSPAFVDAIELQVAQELNGVAIHSLLPWLSIAKSGLAMSAAIVMILAACCIPTAKLPARLARAMIPFLSFVRPSTLQITVLEPSPTLLAVPSDQVIPFAIEVTGGSASEATLELIETGVSHNGENRASNDSESRRVLKMRLEENSTSAFSVSAPISNRATKFRFQTGDAETLFRTITPMARPKAIAFHSVTTPPQYTLSPPESATGDRGDLRLLKGSHVKLHIDVNQSIAQASIAMEFPNSGRKETIALQMVPNKPKQYTADFVVDEGATFQVRLVSEFSYNGSPVENNYSPRYRIDTLDDLSPVVAWNANDKTYWSDVPKPNATFIVAPDEVVNLSVEVTDNLPIERLAHEASINRGAWETVYPDLVHSVSTSKEPFSAQANWTWDVATLAASSGDSVAIRTIAIDRKGNSAQSPTILFSLAAIGFDRDRHKSLLLRSQLVPLLEALSVSLNQSRDTLKPRIESLKDVNMLPEERIKSIEAVRSVVANSAAAASTARFAAERVIKDLGRCVDQAEVELAFRNVARIEKEWLATMSFCLEQPIAAPNAGSGPTTVEWHKRENDQNNQRLSNAYNSACDNAKRLADIYRQFVGFELQASLTQDLTHLLDHQRNVLNRKPNADFIVLSRSQRIAEQYMDEVQKLMTMMEPNLNPDLRNRLGELSRWLDQTRTETRDLATQDETEQTTKELLNRIDRCASELKNVRWAFNLLGHLASDVANCRKELLTRSGSLWPNFERFFDRNNRRLEASKDRSIDTAEWMKRNDTLVSEVTGPLLSALGQMLDRRDVHQRRSFTDPMFASDMGTAHRAWTSVLERWVSEPTNANLHFADAQTIAKAFRILESAHESVEARLVVQSLMPTEQYEWKTLEGQLMNPKQWDSVNLRLEIANQRMREAGIPNVVADKFNALRWSEPAQAISNKLNPRRDANNTNLVSCADEMRSLLALWAEADHEVKPILAEARATLARFSPSVSELAKRAAKATLALEKVTERMASNKSVSDPKPDRDESSESTRSVPSQDRIVQERQRTEARISQLQDALIEQANKQDLLDKAELDYARDSDRSLKLLDTVLPRMDVALDEALAFVDASDAEKNAKVSEAMKREAIASTALEKISEHFALLDEQANDGEASSELARSSAELEKMAAEAAKELSLMPDMFPLRDETDDYQRAEELAELASSDPDTLLKKLETELKRNPSMQQELSEISKSNVQSLANELQNASRTEESLAKKLEDKDARLAGQKRLSIDQLQAAADQAERFAARLLDNADRAAQRATARDHAPAIERAAKELRSISQVARKLGDDTLSQELERVSRELADRLGVTNDAVKSINQAMQGAVEHSNEKDQKRRENVRNESQTIQNQNRNELLHQAKEYVAHTQRQSDQAKRIVQQSQNELNNANKQRQAAKTNLEKNQGNENALENLRQATNHAEQSFLKLKAEEKIAEQAETFLTNAKEQSGTFERAERANLDQPNPQAALAVEQLQKASEQLERIQEQFKSIADAAKQLPLPQTPSATLADHDREQQRILDTVLDVAIDLDRSSRHEERLGNSPAASKLASQAKSVEQLTRGSLKDAKDELQQRANDAKRTERQQSDALKGEEITKKLERSETNMARDNLNKSASELATQSNELQRQLEGMSGSKVADPTTNPIAKSASENTESVMRDLRESQSREMARMLDVLDRQLHSGANSDAPANTATAASESQASQNSPPSQSASQSDQKSKQPGSDEDRNGARSAFKETVKSSAEKLAGSMGQQRLNQRFESQSQRNARTDNSGKQSPGSQKSGGFSSLENASDFSLPGMMRSKNREWGKLREQRVEDAVEGRRDEYDPEFSNAIQAYTKGLGRR